MPNIGKTEGRWTTQQKVSTCRLQVNSSKLFFFCGKAFPRPMFEQVDGLMPRTGNGDGGTKNKWAGLIGKWLDSG